MERRVLDCAKSKRWKRRVIVQKVKDGKEGYQIVQIKIISKCQLRYTRGTLSSTLRWFSCALQQSLSVAEQRALALRRKRVCFLIELLHLLCTRERMQLPGRCLLECTEENHRKVLLITQVGILAGTLVF